MGRTNEDTILDLIESMYAAAAADQAPRNVFLEKLATVLEGRTDPLGEEELAVLHQLLPHLQRALQLQVRIAQLVTQTASTSELLDRLPTGVFLLARRGQVLEMNRAAQVLSAETDGLCIRNGQSGQSSELQTYGSHLSGAESRG